MKKLIVLSIAILSFALCKAQDSVFFGKNIMIGTITNIDKNFIYIISRETGKDVKLPLSVVTNYVYSSTPGTSESENIFIDSYRKKPITNIDSINYRIAYMQYNLGKFNKQIIAGFVITGIGFVIGIAGPQIIPKPDPLSTSYYDDLMDYQNKQMIVSLVGAGISLIGTLVIIDSYKWIKRASIEPTLYGAKLKVNF